MTSSFTRNKKLMALSHLAKPALLTQAMVEKRWADVATTISFAETDAPISLASTGPKLYRQIRDNITRFYLRGGGAISLEKLRRLAQTSPDPA